MGQYYPGQLVHHMAYMPGYTFNDAKLLVDNAQTATTINVQAAGAAGRHLINYTVPTVTPGADLILEVSFIEAQTGETRFFYFRDQARLNVASDFHSNPYNLAEAPYDIVYNAIVDAVLDEAIAGHVSAGSVGEAISDASAGGGGGGGSVDEAAIACAVIQKDVSSVLSECGAIGRQSLGALILAAFNADTTSKANTLTVRHPDTEAPMFEYTITVGTGNPIASIT